MSARQLAPSHDAGCTSRLPMGVVSEDDSCSESSTPTHNDEVDFDDWGVKHQDEYLF